MRSCTLIVLIAAAATAQPAEQPGIAEQARRTNPADAKAVEQLLTRIAGEYKTYKRVSEEAAWAPELCRAPTPGGVLESASKDEGTHGKKLYWLYARDPASYQDMSLQGRNPDPAKPWLNPVGQVVVKEAFRPVLVESPAAPDQRKPLPKDCAVSGGKVYKAGDAAGLFMMVKLDPAAAGTDQGWVYATTSPDGKSITASGRIASCMECHETTGRDRLYGHQWSWPRDKAGKRIPPSEEQKSAGPKGEVAPGPSTRQPGGG